MSLFVQEVENQLEALSLYGADPSGGISRLLYSPEWLETQYYLKQRMEQAGFISRFDAVGNLYGRIEGHGNPNEVILTGSHIDTVVNGGHLDGQFGIIAAFIAIHYLKETYGTPRRTLEVVSLAEEEGSRFPYVFWGSKNIVGQANPADVRNITDVKGNKFIDAMQQCGFTLPDAPLPARRDITAFVELHIEQGGVLEHHQQQLGVVSAIVGQRRYTVTLNGTANHAGTTPMSYRKDTLLAFSQICVAATASAEEHGDPLVLTFGKVVPHPGTVNVVPGKTMFSIDCRHTSQQALLAFTTELEATMRQICQARGIGIDIDLWMDEAPVPMDTQLVAQLDALCREHNARYRVMHSGAGHDAQIFAAHVPTCLLFVPSIQGISHNPAENTEIIDLAAGVEMLAKMLHQLAY